MRQKFCVHKIIIKTKIKFIQLKSLSIRITNYKI
jgi:hypothetical protein